MKKNQKKGMSNGKKMVAGAGVAAGVAALSAGAYYMFGPKAKAHQKKVSALMSKIKKEVQVQARKAKVASGPLYHKAVDMVATKYAKEYKLHEKDIKAFAKILKSDLKKAKKTTKKVVKKLKRKI